MAYGTCSFKKQSERKNVRLLTTYPIVHTRPCSTCGTPGERQLVEYGFELNGCTPYMVIRRSILSFRLFMLMIL